MYRDAGGGVRDLAFLPKVVREDRCPNVETQFVVSKLSVRANDARPERSRLVASGYTVGSPFYPTVLRLGELEFDLTTAVRAGRSIVYRHEGVELRIKQPPWWNRSERWTFKLRITGPEVADVDPDGELEVVLECGQLHGRSRIALERGRYRLGKAGQTFSRPKILIRSAKAALRGGGRDSFVLRFGFAADEEMPAEAPEVTVLFGMHFSATIPSASFVRKGAAYLHRGMGGGVTSVVLDYARRTLTIKAKRADFGLDAYWPSGGEDGERVLLGVAIGETRFSSEPAMHEAVHRVRF